MSSRATPITRVVPRPAVTPDDLAHIDRFLELLRSLDDPFQSGHKLAEHVEQIPVLARRILHRARSRAANRQIETVAQALTLLGNRGLESEMLEVLEELTILKAELEAV